jgi:hypothetical protein
MISEDSMSLVKTKQNPQFITSHKLLMLITYNLTVTLLGPL